MISVPLRRLLSAFAILMTSLAISVSSVSSQTVDNSNLADFEFVTATVEANYSGWSTKIVGARAQELAQLTARLRSEVAAGDDAALRRAVSTYLDWFDDGHLRAQWNMEEAARAWDAPRRPLDEAAARKALASKGQTPAPIEGLWTIDDRYRLAVLRTDQTAERFDAIVLATTVEGWAAGDTKAILTPRSDGNFDVRYGAGDRSELTLTATLLSRNDVLDLGELGIWRRVQANRGATQAALRRYPQDEFVLTRIDARTLYLRLPSFGDAHTETVRTLIAQAQGELASTPNLIIDVRRNGGGSDFVYDPVLPWIATRPIWRIGVEIRVSPLNQRLRREVAEQITAASPEAARSLREESDRMAVATAAFIRREPPVEVVPFAGIIPNPERIAVLIDGAGSSAENFMMDARQSRKVTLMGQTNSAGVIDYGEMMVTAAPSGRFELAWATTRSLRLPQDPVDPEGISPDVMIPSETDDPVAWAAAWLASGKAD